MSEIVELRVALTQADIARITVMADKRGVSMTQVLREAILLKEFVDRKQAEGAKLILGWSDHCYQVVEMSRCED